MFENVAATSVKRLSRHDLRVPRLARLPVTKTRGSYHLFKRVSKSPDTILISTVRFANYCRIKLLTTGVRERNRHLSQNPRDDFPVPRLARFPGTKCRKKQFAKILTMFPVTLPKRLSTCKPPIISLKQGVRKCSRDLCQTAFPT